MRSRIFLASTLFVAVTACAHQESRPAAPIAPLDPSGAPKDVADLIESFWQGPHGNCTSIAFIKAVMRRYQGDIRGAFDQYDETPSALRVYTRGKASTYEISHDELAMACSAFGVNSNAGASYCSDRIPAPAKMFAVLAKACQTRAAGANECQLAEASFSEALDRLNNGLLWKVPPKLLDFREGADGDYHVLTAGRIRRWVHIDSFTSGGNACVVASPWHTFFVTAGFFDRYGQVVRFGHGKGLNALWANHAYCLDGVPTILESNDVEASDEARFKAESTPRLSNEGI